MLLGTINHVALTVTEFTGSLTFFDAFLGFLGYRRREVLEHPGSGSRLAIYLHDEIGCAVNVWEAKPSFARHGFETYAPGLHHLAFNVASREQIDEAARSIQTWGGQLLEGPADYPYEKDGYYAVFFTGPDGMKFECVHMPSEARRFEKRTS